MSRSLVRQPPLRHRLLPARALGELLTKSWIDSIIPVLLLACVVIAAFVMLPGFFSPAALSNQSRQLAEFGILAIGLMVVMLAGGIDLSIGSVFALCVLTALSCMNVLGQPFAVALGATVVTGILCGAVNGFFVGVLRLRAFITTLVTLVIFRAIYELIFPRVANQIVMGFPQSAAWDALGFGALGGVPISFLVFCIVAIATHVTLSRLRIGWHIRAIGGARRSAFNSGVAVRRTVALTYVFMGLMTALAAFLFSARLASTGADTGIGLEILILTAVVLGGVQLGGGRGSVGTAIMGTAIVLILTNGLIRFGAPGNVNQLVLGVVLIATVIVDAKWVKNRGKVLDKLYVSPSYLDLPEIDEATSAKFALNDALGDAEIIGHGVVEGPEDVALDLAGNLYTGTRHGEIVRFLAPDFTRHEVFAKIGGHPLGMTFDAAGNLAVCVGGMGVYRVSPEGEVGKITDETRRSALSIIDDSRLRLPDDLDIAPDGRIFFTEATKRYEMAQWATDALEGRGNGRLLCFDPRTGRTSTLLGGLYFANGVTVCEDGVSLIFAETWACHLVRYWFDGPRKGQRELFVRNLPGYPDNVNRASDGGYWLALLGMRTPGFDLAMTHPGFRRRLVRRLSSDNWLFPNINRGCVVKLSASGEVERVLWDAEGSELPSVTSMREHRGWLYLGGVTNNRIGRVRLPDADQGWTAQSSYWGKG